MSENKHVTLGQMRGMAQRQDARDDQQEVKIENHTHSYPNLSNKPTEIIGCDTVTWDGNTDGLVNVGHGDYFKVSDATLTRTDFANGATTRVSDGYDGVIESVYAAEDMEFYVNDQGYADFGELCVVPPDYESYIFDEPGVYFKKGTLSLTIPGYTGFSREVLKPEALPQHTHKWSDIEDPVCGESFGDTLTWDGNRGELAESTVTDYPSYKCSDAVVTLEDIANGLSYTLSDGRTRIPDPDLMYMWMKLDSFIYDQFAFVNNEYAAENGYEPGIYLSGYEDAEGKYIYVKSLTIPGYTGFPVVKKLDAKYLPEDHINALIDAKLGVIENGAY